MTNDVFHKFLMTLSGDHDYSIDRHRPQADIYYKKRLLLIKNPDHDSEIKYIGGVMLCEGYDLHAYIFPEYRRQGIMKDFMNSIVIPYMYNVLDMTKIEVTGLSAEGIALLRSLGFKNTTGEWWVLEK